MPQHPSSTPENAADRDAAHWRTAAQATKHLEAVTQDNARRALAGHPAIPATLTPEQAASLVYVVDRMTIALAAQHRRQ